MDVLALDLLHSTSAPGSPGRSPSANVRGRRASLSAPIVLGLGLLGWTSFEGHR